jgi:hypothetical protein
MNIGQLAGKVQGSDNIGKWVKWGAIGMVITVGVILVGVVLVKGVKWITSLGTGGQAPAGGVPKQQGYQPPGPVVPGLPPNPLLPPIPGINPILGGGAGGGGLDIIGRILDPLGLFGGGGLLGGGGGGFRLF